MSPAPAPQDWSRGHLRARPATAGEAWEAGPGIHPLSLGAARDGQFLVPPGLNHDKPHPLLIMLHGAGGHAAHAIAAVRGEAEARGIIVLAPESRGGTWDVVGEGFGPDVSFIDRALEVIFGRLTIDPARIAVGGFSDGASYALSLGLTNGPLVSTILAFSPGFAAPQERTGKPRIFITHGTQDTVLPIDRCSRRIARALTEDGYDVDYREFEGGHVLPPDLVAEGLARVKA